MDEDVMAHPQQPRSKKVIGGSGFSSPLDMFKKKPASKMKNKITDQK